MKIIKDRYYYTAADYKAAFKITYEVGGKITTKYVITFSNAPINALANEFVEAYELVKDIKSDDTDECVIIREAARLLGYEVRRNL